MQEEPSHRIIGRRELDSRERAMGLEDFLASERLGLRAWRGEDLPLAIELWTDVWRTGLFGGDCADYSVVYRSSSWRILKQEYVRTMTMRRTRRKAATQPETGSDCTVNNAKIPWPGTVMGIRWRR